MIKVEISEWIAAACPALAGRLPSSALFYTILFDEPCRRGSVGDTYRRISSKHNSGVYIGFLPTAEGHGSQASLAILAKERNKRKTKTPSDFP